MIIKFTCVFNGECRELCCAAAQLLGYSFSTYVVALSLGLFFLLSVNHMLSLITVNMSLGICTSVLLGFRVDHELAVMDIKACEQDIC